MPDLPGAFGQIRRMTNVITTITDETDKLSVAMQNVFVYLDEIIFRFSCFQLSDLRHLSELTGEPSGP